MFDVNVAAILIVSLLVLVAFGVHIAVALGIASALGIYLVTGDIHVVTSMLGSTAYEALRDYVFAVIPLFMLMGEFIGRSGAVTDVYKGINRGLRHIPGRLAIATVLGNALFSFVTGVSIASAAAFSRISYPEMRRHGYDRGFALGTVAGSSCLGMLIPPSVLMIVWGILTEKSIGQIFLAGVIPGIMIAGFYCLYALVVALIQPHKVGGAPAPGARDVHRRRRASWRHRRSSRKARGCKPGAAAAASPWWSSPCSAASGSACSRRPRAPAPAPSSA